jgi:hypothetical protein
MAASNQEVLDYLSSSSNLSDADIYSFMQSRGVPASQIANVTGIPLSDVVSRVADVAPAANMLGGVILAGDSWLSGESNTALANTAFGQNVSNVAVGGSTTQDALNQLNSFIGNGGNFQNGSTIVLDIGGNDLLQGVNKDTVKSNLNEIVSKLGNEGVKVILSGAPSVGSVSDVTSSTQLAMDSLYNDVAKTNNNVTVVDAMSGLLNQKSLVDETGFHLNTAGQTSFINQLASAVNPQTTPPAAVAELIAPTLQTGQRMPVIPTARGTVIEGDNIDAQIAGVPQSVYQTRVDPNNTANWETYNPQTGEVINRGTFAGGGDQGLLAASRPVLALAASVLGAPYLSEFIAGSTGLTGSALSGATGATIAGGSTALTGGSAKDTLTAALIGGGGGYLGSEFNNYLDTGTFADPGITERQFATLDAKQLANQGLSTAQIRDVMSAGGYNDIIIDRAVASLATTPTGTSATLPPTTTATDSVNITGTQNLPINAGGMLSTIANPVIQAGTVNVQGTTTPQQVDQATLALVNSQIAANLGTPANLANVQVTGDRPATTPSNAISNVAATLPNVTSPPSSSIPTQTITATNQPPVGSTLSLLPATMLTPSVTNSTTTTPTKKTNELGLTDEQMLRLLQAGLGLFGTVGATTSLANRGTTNPVGLPTQTPPMYTDDYFTKVQQNYNRLLPAVPRDVASPLRDWYTSQYGA